MTNRFLTLLALPCAALALSAQARAQPAPDQPPPPPRDGGFRPGMEPGFFARFDLNHDGKVTREEYDQVTGRMFTRLDRNRDGVVTRNELPRHHGPMGGRMGWPGMRHCEPPTMPPDGPRAMRMPPPVQDGAPGFAQGRPDDPPYRLWTAAPSSGYGDRNGDTR